MAERWVFLKSGRLMHFLTNFSSLLSCIFMHKYVCTYLPSLKNGLNLQYDLVKHHN